MRKSDAISYFGSQQGVADALGITRSAVCHWPDDLDRIPFASAYQLQVITRKALKIDASMYPKIRELPSRPSYPRRAKALTPNRPKTADAESP